MRVLMTGHDGYIGAVMVPIFEEAGHEVVGLDSHYFRGCAFGPEPSVGEGDREDVRKVETERLEGFDCVVHLAALSNDPLGNINPDVTYGINFRASVELARRAKEAGVPRFLYSSSCSLYGAAAGEDFLTEEAEFNPVTPYAESKVRSEQEISKLASDDFSPVFMRNATAYGLSPRLRADLVVNNLVGYAYTTGEVLIKSDGSPWRPLVHIRDISTAFLAAAEAPVDKIHNVAMNIGQTSENYRIREIGTIVQETVPNSKVTYADGASPDKRDYRVNCDFVKTVLPNWKPEWTVPKGVEELYHAYRDMNLTEEQFMSSAYWRLRRVSELQERGEIDDEFRWAGA